MLYSMKDLLLDAKKNKYGIGAFNLVSLEQAHITISCAEKLNAPLITQIAEIHFDYIDYKELIDYLKFRIRKSHIPIALHLDHGVSFNGVMTAINSGFTSVMYDGSSQDYNTNVEKTKEIVNICHAAGVTVEAELGHIGEEGGFQGKTTKDFFTNPEQAIDFVKQTNIDALAISFGNVHGFYQGEPNLDFELLETIATQTNIPIVLHGGSGISAKDFQKAISLGVCKINFFTYVEDAILKTMKTTGSQVKSHLLVNKNLEIRKNIETIVTKHIEIFGGKNKCYEKFLD